MNKGRSTYTFTFNCDPNLVNNLVQSYIQGNQYTLQQQNGEQFYRAGEPVLQGYRYFNYRIQGQTLTIYAWFKGVIGEMSIEQNSFNITATNYRNSLNTLFQEIYKLNNGGSMNNNMNFDPNTGQSLNQNVNNNQMNSNVGQPLNQPQPVSNNVNQFTQKFQNENMKKQEKMCEIGFWLSILGLLCSFVGVTYGLILYVLIFYFASQGLKTRKRGKAIATIVLSIISILNIVIQVMNIWNA